MYGFHLQSSRASIAWYKLDFFLPIFTPVYNLRQEYDQYGPEDFLVWKLLFEKQTAILKDRAASDFNRGIQLMGFDSGRIADFNAVNQVLAETTGWSIEVVPGLIPDKDFFELLSIKRFPSSTWLRPIQSLEYLEQPDMFHDCFAHMPLLTEPFFVNFLQALSRIALRHIDDALAIELVGRIYWFTIEFGLILEPRGLRIYGAGILSSSSESIYCLSDQANRKPLDVKEILEKPYYKNDLQDRYYVIRSYKELFESIPRIEDLIDQAIRLVPDEKKVDPGAIDLVLSR